MTARWESLPLDTPPPEATGKPRPGTCRRKFVLPEVSETDPPEVRNAVAARNAATVAGLCPSCGAVFRLQRTVGGITVLNMEHDDDCPAIGPVAP